jgi:hypothetical protein
MNVIDNLSERATGMRSHGGLRRPLIMEITERPTGKVPVPSWSPREEYELTAKIGVTFWANAAQYEGARREAEKHLTTVLYADFLRLVDKCAHAISDGDEGDALTACGEMRAMILGR